MSEAGFDFAVMGHSAFAATLALALARRHDARVCLIGKTPAPLQIVRDIALSCGPYSRPETLRVLGGAAGELRALLGGSDDPVLERRNVTFTAQTGPGRIALSHARHMLAAFGVVTSLLPETVGVGGFVAEGVWSLRPRAFFAGLAHRLAEAGVVGHAAIDDLHVGREKVRFSAEDTSVTAKRLILTDASAISAIAPLPGILSLNRREAMLTEPVPGFAGRFIVDAETGGFVTGRTDGSLEAVGPADESGSAAAWLGGLLPPGTAVRIVAARRHEVVSSRDGSPVIDALSGKAAEIAAGFGVSGAFFAPALARHLTGNANADEQAWFAARAATEVRAGVADIGLIGGGTI